MDADQVHQQVVSGTTLIKTQNISAKISVYLISENPREKATR